MRGKSSRQGWHPWASNSEWCHSCNVSGNKPQVNRRKLRPCSAWISMIPCFRTVSISRKSLPPPSPRSGSVSTTTPSIDGGASSDQAGHVSQGQVGGRHVQPLQAVQCHRCCSPTSHLGRDRPPILQQGESGKRGRIPEDCQAPTLPVPADLPHHHSPGIMPLILLQGYGHH